MDDTAYLRYFTQPSHTFHRQYEALRAVFVEHRSQKDVAQQFGFQYHAFRQLIYEFRKFRDANPDSEDSPFFGIPE